MPDTGKKKKKKGKEKEEEGGSWWSKRTGGEKLGVGCCAGICLSVMTGGFALIVGAFGCIGWGIKKLCCKGGGTAESGAELHENGERIGLSTDIEMDEDRNDDDSEED